MSKNKDKLAITLAIIITIAAVSTVALLYMHDNGQDVLSDINEPNFYQAMTIHYTDGSSKEYKPQDATSLTILDANSGKEVSFLTVTLYAKPTFTGSVTSYTVDGSASWKLAKSAPYNVLESFNRPIEQTGSNLVSGQRITVTSGTLTANDLEAMADFQNGHYYKITVDLTSFAMTLKFDDGSQKTKTASADPVTWEFQYGGSYTFSSLEVSWGIDT